MRHAWLGAVVAAATLATAGDSIAGGSTTGIAWTRDYTAAVQEAEQTGRPLLLNFYCGT